MQPTSERPEAGPLDRRAAQLLALMAGVALACVAAGLSLRWLGSAPESGERFLAFATTLVVLAPLVSLIGIALVAMRGQRRLALLAVATLVVTLVGMALAR